MSRFMFPNRTKRPIVLLPIGARLRIIGVLPPIMYQQYYSQTLAAYGAHGNVKWKVDGALPTGVTWYYSALGTITFTTLRTSCYGDYPITVTVTDQERNVATRDFMLRVMRFPMPHLYVDENQTHQYVSSSGKLYISE